MAGFSSQGPTDVHFRVKPDVVAPGVNVLSSQPAGPAPDAAVLGVLPGHVDGDAARRRVGSRGDRPAPGLDGRRRAVGDREHGEFAACSRTSATGKIVVDNPNVVGAGLENLYNAVQAKVSLDPVSIAFGGVPSGSGQSRSGEIIVKNLTGATATFTFSIEDPFASGARTP